MYTALCLAVLVVSLIKKGCAQEDCEPDFPDFSGPSQHSRMLRGQLIVPAYSFPCNDSAVTRWEAELHQHGRHRSLERIDFQVWRLLDQELRLVGSNSYSADTDSLQDQGVSLQGDRLVMDIEGPDLIFVSAGDVVGVYIEGEGIELKYKSSKDIQAYSANLSGQELTWEEFDADLDHSDSIFKQFKGAPLVRAKTDNGIGGGELTTAMTAQGVSETISSTHPSKEPTLKPSTKVATGVSSTHHTTVLSPASGPAPGPQLWSLEHLVGAILGGGVVILAALSIVLGVLIHRRRRRRGRSREGVIDGDSSTTITATTSPEFFKSSGSDGILFAYPQSDAKKEISFFSFKKQDLARKGVPKPLKSGAVATGAKKPGEADGQGIVTVEDCIEMKVNVSYSSVDSCTDKDISMSINAEYGYDAPLSEVVLQPFEYEKPLEVPTQNEYETIPDLAAEDRIYEEIYSTVR